MSWKDNLQQASFRGITFHVEGDDLGVGRRSQTHEYPGRDKPFTEDMGRATRKGSIEAFLIGADYMAARDRLLSALEQGGAGELVHPWYGRMTVNIDDGCRVRHSAKDGGYCAVTISFVEAGELAFPSAAESTAAQALIAAEAAKAASLTEFEKFFTIGGLPSFVQDNALASFGKTMRTLEAGMLNLRSVNKVAMAALNGDLSALLPNSYSLANRFYGLFTQAEGLISGADADEINQATAGATVGAVALFPVPAATTGGTAARQQSNTNDDAIATLASGALLVQAAGMTSLMALPVFEDAARLRTELMRALDAHCQRVQTDESFAAFRDLRSKVHQDITRKTRSAARLREFTPLEVSPAIVLAYDLYEDTSREAEIIARNKIRHPGFVPAQPLKVLTA